MSQKRRKARRIIDLPLSLAERGKVLDDDAVVHDLTPEGFGFETRRTLKRGARFTFEITLPGSARARGEAEVRWLSSGSWGTWAGARITKISRRDVRLIKKALLGPGYDWAGLWDRALTAAFIIAVALLLDDLIRHHRTALYAGWNVLPDIIAVGCMGVSALWFLRRRR